MPHGDAERKNFDAPDPVMKRLVRPAELSILSRWHKTAVAVVGCAIGCAAAPSVSAASSVVCPAKVRLEAGRVASADVPADFKVTVESMPMWLSGMSVYDGPPEQGASLVPTVSSRKGDRSTWKFETNVPDGKWLSCDYGQGVVHVSTRADDRSTSCEAVATRSGDPRILSGTFTCR